MAFPNPHRGPIGRGVLSTKYTDDETGLVMYQLRAYSPELGRFISRDPIDENGGLNLYSFCANDGVNAVDLYGLALYAFDGTGNTYDQNTHVAMLFNSYRGNREYELGVGTILNGLLDNSWVGGLTGAGGKDRLESMYKKFVANYGAGDHEVDIIGFSRGAALAREFANMLYSRGYKIDGQTYRDSSASIGSNPLTLSSQKCDVKIRFVGLFDTVGSFGIPGNSANFGIRMDLPQNVQHAAQAIAKDEKRALFPLTRLNSPRAGQVFHEQVFKGDHSDIGGGWGQDQNMLAKAPLTYIWREGRSAGVPFGVLPDRYLQMSYTPHDNSGVGHSVLVDILYNISPIPVLIRGGFTNPSKSRDLREGPL